MWKRLGLGLLTLVAMALLAACGTTSGGSGGGGGGGGGGSENVDPAQTTQVLSGELSRLNQLVLPLAQMGVPVPLIPFPFSSQGLGPLDTWSWNCTGLQPTGDLRDGDRDGVPVDARYNGRCTYTSGSGEATWEYQDLRVQDPNDSDPLAGFRVGGRIVFSWQFTANNRIHTGSLSWDITELSHIRQGSTWNLTYRFTWTLSLEGQPAYVVAYDSTGTWTPDNPGDGPWGRTGQLTLQGSLTVRESNNPLVGINWNVNVHIASCGVDSGTISVTYTDPNGRTCSFTITVNGCGNFSAQGGCS